MRGFNLLASYFFNNHTTVERFDKVSKIGGRKHSLDHDLHSLTNMYTRIKNPLIASTTTRFCCKFFCGLCHLKIP